MDDRITFSDVIEELTGFGIPVWAGAFTWIAVFALEIFLIKRGVILAGKEKKIEKAKREGHVIVADAVRRSFRRRGANGRTGDDLYYCTYEYTVDGVTRRYAIVQSGHYPPDQVTLYYTSNPKRVFSAYDHSVWEVVQKVLVYVIPTLAMVGVMLALGFQPEQ